MHPARARSRELDHFRERPCTAFLREPEEGDDDLGRREGVRQRAVTRLGRGTEEVRELREREPLAPAVQEPSREPHRVDHRRGHASARQTLHRVVEEADVEARVVRGERCVAGEREEPPDGDLGSRRAAQLHIAETGQPRDGRRKRDAGLYERLERLGDLERRDAHGADLADAVARGGQPRRLEIENDELRILDEDVLVGAACESDATAEPGEPGVAVHDVGEERVDERRRCALEREEHARGLLDSDGPAPRVDQLHEAVGGVEGELHGAPP